MKPQVTIYHNPQCGTSRNTLGLIRNAGIEPVIIEYLVQPPGRDLLAAMIRAAGLTVREALRQKGTPYAELGLDDARLPDDELLEAMMRHPILINRPFVVSSLGTKLCRPSEVVLDILPLPQRGYFAREDGQVVIDANGQRVSHRPATNAAQVRAATHLDAGTIAQIYNYYVGNTVITFEEDAVPADEMSRRITEVQARGLPWLVAERDGEIVGYSHAAPWKARAAYRQSVETTIYLRHGMEGRGIGRTLYSALLPILKERGIHAVIGGAALPNPASVALHAALGFERVATFREVGFKFGRRIDVAYWQRIL